MLKCVVLLCLTLLWSPVGARAATQFAGPGEDNITLSGILMPEAAGTLDSIETIRAMADHGLPVCGHVGLIPSKRTWTGGFQAVGKTLETTEAELMVWVTPDRLRPSRR